MSHKIKDFWRKQAILSQDEQEKLTIIDQKQNVFVDSRGGGGTLKDNYLRDLCTRNLL